MQSTIYCFYTTTDSEYFATFEKESGERMEFLLGGSEYGMIAEEYGMIAEEYVGN